jgi:hypothetical protein
MTANPLLHSNLTLGVWLSRLPRVSARLYEVDVDVWEQFEPARRAVHDSIVWLGSEGFLSIDLDTPQSAIAKEPRSFEKYGWIRAAEIAKHALGQAALAELLERA